MRLFPSERRVLEALPADNSGFPVKVILRHLGRSGRSEAGQVTYALKSMEARGLCARLDDKKPVAWMLTDAGRQTLSQ